MSAVGQWPLQGLHVVDATSGIAGAYCAKLLCDAGATVTKVEAPAGDPLRRWRASGEAPPEGEDGALFQFLNAAKRSIALDLTVAGDREWFLRLAATADLVIEDFGPSGLQRRGLALSQLHARNPRLSLVSLSPWGLTGPWAERPATEFTLQAAVGATASRGLPGRPPVAAGGRIGEWVQGCFAAVSAMATWLGAADSGRGQQVDLSAFEAMLLTMNTGRYMTAQWQGGTLPRSIEIPSIEPAADGWVGFCTVTAQQWADFCALIGQPQLAEDERYLSSYARMEDMDTLRRLIREWTTQHSVAEIIETASLMRIPVAPVGNGASVVAMDHLRERGVFVRNPGGFIQPRPPYSLSDATLRPPGPAPALDQHRQLVLDELASKAGEGPTPQEDKGGDTLPLNGVRVVDLTAFWAGPFATGMLADLGAEVIKVESVQRPDGMRFSGAAEVEGFWEWSPVFAAANTGKQGITLQLDDEAGQALLWQLLRRADVLIENFSVRVLDQFGIDWPRVQAANPRCVLLRMPAFGLDGPWRDRTGFAMTVEQVSGLAWTTGYDDTPLVPRGVCDPVGGLHAVFALLLALRERRRSGRGQLVEVPLVESALNIAAEQVVHYSAYAELLDYRGNRSAAAVPQGVYRCAGDDEWLALSIVDDAQWHALTAEFDAAHPLRRATLTAATERRVAEDEIDRELSTWLATREAQAIEARLLASGVPAQRLVNAQAVAPNPQLEHRRFFRRMTHPVTGPTDYPGQPVRYSRWDSDGLRDERTKPPPTLGQHNEDILCGLLGLDARQLQDLRERLVIGEQPLF